MICRCKRAIGSSYFAPSIAETFKGLLSRSLAISRSYQSQNIQVMSLHARDAYLETRSVLGVCRKQEMVGEGRETNQYKAV